MIQALALLIAATQLLIAVNKPDVPVEFKKLAISVAEHAIKVANETLNVPGASTIAPKPPEVVVATSTISVSPFAQDFKLSHKVYPETRTIELYADGWRDNVPESGYFKWWTVNLGNYVIAEGTTTPMAYTEESKDIVPVGYKATVLLRDISPNETKGYTRHFFRFYFGRGQGKSETPATEFAIGL